jgi:anti-sigma B factor antagonist
MPIEQERWNVSAEQATFRRCDREGLRTLTVNGEIDLVTAARFEAELEAVISEAHSPADVDLSGVTFIDSSGLHALLRAREHVAGTEVRLVLVNPSKACLKVLEVTDTTQLFEIAARNGQ